MKLKITLKLIPLVFRRWSNKGFAVFNSIKKSVVIGCLLVAYLLFANPETTNAQNDSDAVTKNYDLESIDVTSDQLPETYSNISRVVVTITKSEIERAAVSSVNELLEYASNIDIRQRGTNGIQADISIRGGSFDQVLVLLNGVNITDPQTGHHNLNLPLDLSSIERIEVLKGPGAWKFGPGAFSGAINIITKTTDVNYLKAAVELGQFSTQTEKLSAGLKLGQSSHFLSAIYSQTDGYVQNTDNQIANLFYQGNLSFNKNEISVQAGATEKSFGANSFYTAKYPNQYEEIQTYFLSVGVRSLINKLQIEPNFYYRRNNDRFVLFRANPEWYSNFHTSDVYGINTIGSLIHGSKALTSGGIDFRNETIYSNNLGEITENTRLSPVNDTITLNRFHTRSNYSAFVGHKRYFNQFMVNVGVNLTHNTDIENKWFLFPGIDLNYNFNKNSSFFASANKTMRMPTYTDLFYQGPSNEGNSYLLPEEAMGYEIGYKYEHDLITYSFNAFYVEGENLIDWVRENVDQKWRTINHTQLNTLGFEFSLETDLQKIMPEQSILKKLKVNYSNINQEKLNNDLISNYSLNYLKHRADVNLYHHIWKNISATWHVAFQDRNGQYEQIINAESVGMVDFEPFFTADVKIYWNYAGWSVYTSVVNLFNVEYYDFGNVPQPGRWVKVGIAKHIDFK